MNNERRVNTGDPSPHFDGKKEGPISDPTGGPTMGIRSDIDPNNPMENNPYHLTNIKDEEMEHLDEVIGGKKVENKSK